MSKDVSKFVDVLYRCRRSVSKSVETFGTVSAMTCIYSILFKKTAFARAAFSALGVVAPGTTASRGAIPGVLRCVRSGSCRIYEVVLRRLQFGNQLLLENCHGWRFGPWRHPFGFRAEFGPLDFKPELLCLAVVLSVTKLFI